MLANFWPDLFSIIVSSYKLVVYVGGHAQILLIGFMVHNYIHRRFCWTRLYFYSNIHQLIQKMYRSCCSIQVLASTLLVFYNPYFFLLYHLNFFSGYSFGFVQKLMNRNNWNLHLRYLAVRVFEFEVFEKLSFAHNFELVVNFCFCIGMVDKRIQKLTALNGFALGLFHIVVEMSSNYWFVVVGVK